MTMSPRGMTTDLKKKVKKITSSSHNLKPKPFFWDSITFSITSTIFALSDSGIIANSSSLI